jgi:hypothetical protein
MISLALVRASFKASLTFSWACARSFWLRSAAARPSAIFCWRSSMALSSGGQILVAMIQIRPAKGQRLGEQSQIDVHGCALPVLELLARAQNRAACCRHGRLRGDRPVGITLTDQPARSQCTVKIDERAGEGEQQANGDRDDERGVDQAGGDEHAHLQDRDQFRLAGGRFQELAGHDGQTQAGAQRGQADHDADGQAVEDWTWARLVSAFPW